MGHSHFLNLTFDIEENKQQRHATFRFLRIECNFGDPPPGPHMYSDRHTSIYLCHVPSYSKIKCVHVTNVALYLFPAGVKVTGVETVRLATSHAKESVSAEDTHFESHGHRGTCVVYAVRLYVDDDCGSLSKKDLNPEPKLVKLTDHHCTLL